MDPRKPKPDREDAIEASRKKKKPKKSWDEATYNPKYTNQKKKPPTHRDGILSMRVNTENKVEVEEGVTQPFKFAVRLKSDRITTSLDKDKLESEYQANLAKNTYHRPIKAFTQHNSALSPMEVETPGGTKLPKFTDLHVLSIFAPRRIDFSAEAIKFNLDASHTFYESKEYERIKTFGQALKERQMIISQSSLKKTETERKKNHYLRPTDQNTQMAKSGKSKEGSATQYAEATNLFLTGVNWEWLHLIAFEMEGAKSQTDKNLIAGTKHANSLMMLVEGQMAYLAKHYPQGFDLKVAAHLIEKTNADEKEYLQVGTTIDYIIKTKDFEVPFKFNAQEFNEPHIAFKDAVASLFTSLVTLSQLAAAEAEKENQPPTLR